MSIISFNHAEVMLFAGGSLTRAKDQARIDFLAQARNRALEPLWLNNSMATSTSLLLPHDIEVRQLPAASHMTWSHHEQVLRSI